MTQTTTLEHLKPGHEYPGASVNARSTGREQDLEGLTASIKAEGILQSLLVCRHPKGNGALYVIAGNRRLAALRKLKWDKGVPIIIRDDVTPGSALGLSLAENITQCPLHPVDRYETFAALTASGKTEADISAAYAVSERVVKQSLALGRLAPKIREAWRRGDVDAAGAQSFTLAKSHKEQEHVFDRLKKSHTLSAWSIRSALVGNQEDTKRLMKVVGREAYEKAGGTIQVDLFARRRGQSDQDDDGEDDDGEFLVSDHALLIRLAGEVIETKCKELIASGWSWAVDEDDAPNEARWSWKKIEKAHASAPKEQKARSGCLVSIDWEGKLEINYGLIKPGTKAVTKEGKLEKKKAGPAVVSNSLRQDLTAMAWRATKDALAPDAKGDGLEYVLARIVAAQIAPDRTNYMPEVIRKSLDALMDAIAPKAMTEALQNRFDRKRYFASAPKPLVIKAIAESVGAEQAKKLSNGTKAAAWKFALANVPKTWLPPELRTSHYDGKTKKKAA